MLKCKCFIVERFDSILIYCEKGCEEYPPQPSQTSLVRYSSISTQTARVGDGLGIGNGSVGDGIGIGSVGEGVGIGSGIGSSGVGVGCGVGLGSGVGVGVADGRTLPSTTCVF